MVTPAAVALHTTMDLRCDAPTTVVFTPETTSAQTLRPEPKTLTGRLLLADRGSLDLHAMRRVHDAGSCCLLRAKAGMHPQGIEAFRDDGTRLRSLRNKPLKRLHATLPNSRGYDPAITHSAVCIWPTQSRILTAEGRRNR